MNTIVDQLPPEFASLIHPDCGRNESAYWVARDQLLAQYENQWIGFAEGRVVAFGKSPVAVLYLAEATGLRPFVICVGFESKPTRIRPIPHKLG